MFSQADDVHTIGENLHDLCLLSRFVASSAYHHWVWTLAIAAAFNIFLGTRQIRADPSASGWFLSGLGYWVQDLPLIVYLIFMVIGIIAGLIYGVATKSPLKISMFFGGVAGSLFLPMLLLLFDTAAAILFIAGILFILYWIFC
jgi:hypothetical protein